MSETTAAAQPPTPVVAPGTPIARRLPLVLPWAVLGLTLYVIERSLGGLLSQVQAATDATFGGMESLASGFGPGVVDRTQGLLDTWAMASRADATAGTHDLIAWTARAYTVVDYLFLLVYAIVLVTLWRRVRRHLPPAAGGDPATRSRLRRAAYWRRGPLLAVAAAGADAVENALRLYFVEESVAGNPVPNAMIRVAWVFTTAKLLLLGTCVVMLLVLLRDTGLLGVWARRTLRALWRLRVVVVAVTLYTTLLLFDATGQATDLARRWVDDGAGLFAGAFVLAGSLLLGFSVWLYARRVVLSDQTQRPSRVRWTPLILAFAALTAALAAIFGFTELYAFTALAVLILLAGWVLFRTSLTTGATREEVSASAADSRRRDAARPAPEDVLATRRTARALAVTAPLTVFFLAASAYAPVMVVLPLSGQQNRTVFALAVAFVAGTILFAPPVALAACFVLRSWDGALSSTPDQLERRYVVGGIGVVAVFAASLVGAVLHWPLVTAFLVVGAFLAALMLVLGELQRWSETHAAPPGILSLGFTRLPVATLLVVALVGSSFVLNDGHAHDVHRRSALPAGLVGHDGTRNGVNLQTAFEQWVAGNCAGPGHTGPAVPLILVAAPGGGVRAAYWTASTLTDLFGADRSRTVPGCDAAPADRIFAMGGASGGSLGVLSYEAGLTGTRTRTWYEDQLGRPDFLTDPLSWMLTTDLARAFVGFGGEDRARRLEDSFSRHVTGLGDDFFAGTWGLGGRAPLMLLTGTQVESGCRLNVSGFRLTDLKGRTDGLGCASLGTRQAQSDAPVTTDVLDVLCDAGGANPTSLSRATAALLSARFPYVSPSGQLYGCAPAGHTGTTGSTAIVDGGYAENTGVGLLLSLWLRLEPLIAAHNLQAGNATIVPVLVEVDNHYAQVATPTVRGRTVEGLVPPLTRARPDQLDDRAEEQQAAATFDGAVPGAGGCDLSTDIARFLVISPRTSPGLPAPLAWTLSRLATADLDAQRGTAMRSPETRRLISWAGGTVRCAP